MKTIAVILLIYPAWLCAALAEHEASYLNRVILTLPAEYFGDIPLDDRAEMLTVLSAEEKFPRLNYDKHFLVWAVDSERQQGGIKASCTFAVKLLPRYAERNFPSPYPPYVFVFMDRAGASGTAPTENQAFVLRWKRGEWIDVSDSVIPEGVDRKRHLWPQRDYAGIKVSDYQEETDYQSTRNEKLLIWKNDRLQIREPFPFSSDCTTNEPFNPEELAVLALKPDRDPRRLMWLIVYAGLEGDERFRYLLESEELKKDESVALALASYEYALDRTQEPLDFITGVMEREGGGDTNSHLIIGYMDEWDRTAEAYRNFGGGDGAAAEAKGLFLQTREFLYPDKFRQHREKFRRPESK